jgi:hypothetical protein
VNEVEIMLFSELDEFLSKFFASLMSALSFSIVDIIIVLLLLGTVVFTSFVN